INLLKPILDDMLTHGAVSRPARPWLGVFPAESNGEVVVMNVSEGGPADQAGLKRGDVISDVRDAGVGSLAEFYRRLWDSGEAGAEVPLRIVRDGRDSWLRVKTGDRTQFLKRPSLQ
ncbi:MAG: S1C family serine protease, partial [Devosia sp.]